MRILFVSGGSAGHLAPMAAVLRAMQELDPKAEALFLCSTKEEDQSFLKKEDIPFETAPLPRRSMMAPVQLWKAYKKSKEVIAAFQPDVVFSKGGALSIPCAFAAKRKGIPVVLHESDAVMGRANRVVARWADVVCMGMQTTACSNWLFARGNQKKANSQKPIAKSRSVFTGNPIRPEMTKGDRAKGFAITHLTGTRPILLVYGGSQGSEALNDFVRRHIEELLSFCDVIHLTGRGKEGAGKHTGYWSRPFVQEEMADLYAIANIAVSRAGAGNISELAVTGIPAVLVPLPGLAQDHQTKNAEAAAAQGGFLCLPQPRLEEDLLPILRFWMENEEERLQRSEKNRAKHIPEASRRIAEILAGCVALAKKSH